jgi:hypothetical protein
MSETNDPPKPPDAPAPVFEAGAFDAFMAKVSTKASSGNMPAETRRRRVTFTMDHNRCEPEMFKAPFRLTLMGLSSSAEKKAIESSSDSTAAGFAMAKLGLVAFNGRPLKPSEKDALWDALGFAGRTITTNTWMKHCTGLGDQSDLEAALGESLAVTIE